MKKAETVSKNTDSAFYADMLVKEPQMNSSRICHQRGGSRLSPAKYKLVDSSETSVTEP